MLHFYMEAVVIFSKIVVLKNFTNFTGKHLCFVCVLFCFLISLQAWGLKACIFIKKRLQHRCFPVKFAKILRAPFLQNISSGCFCLYFFIKVELYLNLINGRQEWLKCGKICNLFSSRTLRSQSLFSAYKSAYFQYISITLNLAYIKNKLFKTLDYWSRDMPNFDFLEKGLGVVSPSHFVYNF